MAKAVDYRIIIDAAKVEAALHSAGVSFTRYRRSWLVRSANTIRDAIEERAPVGVAGLAGQGIQNNISIDYDGSSMPTDQTDLAKIGPNKNVPYAEGVEKGTRPHRPPTGQYSSLRQWAELKGLNVYAVAASIEKKGTKPHPFVGPAYRAVKSKVEREFNEGVTAYIRRFA